MGSPLNGSMMLRATVFVGSRITARQLNAIRRSAPGFAVEEISPSAFRATLGRTWAVVLLTHAGWESSGPWQLVRDQVTLRERNQLREILREHRVINL